MRFSTKIRQITVLRHTCEDALGYALKTASGSSALMNNPPNEAEGVSRIRKQRINLDQGQVRFAHDFFLPQDGAPRLLVYTAGH